MIKLDYDYETIDPLTDEKNVIFVRFDDLPHIEAELNSKSINATMFNDAGTGLAYVEVGESGADGKFCASMKDKPKPRKQNIVSLNSYGKSPGQEVMEEIDKYAVATRIFKAKIGRKPLYEDPEVMKFVMEALAK